MLVECWWAVYIPQTNYHLTPTYVNDKTTPWNGRNTNFGTNTHKRELYLLSFGCFCSVWHLKKWPNDNKYNSGLCVFVLKFAYLSQQYNEISIIIICSSKNLIQ